MCADTCKIFTIFVKNRGMKVPIILQAALSVLLGMPFNDGTVPGVEGRAMLFDGFDSRIVLPAAEVPEPKADFTVDVWVCPIAFPKSPCPVVCRKADDGAHGWDLWLDCFGKVHFTVEGVEAESPQGLPLREWSRLTALFKSGEGIFLAVDGKEVSKAPVTFNKVDQSAYDLWIGRTQTRTPSFLENHSIPIYSSFDGAIDELNMYACKGAYKKILGKKFFRPAAPGTDVPGFEVRILPSGPDQVEFGAWYVPLKYYDAFDRRWRGSLDDIVVGFGPERPWKVVFWHGISYAPCFVTEKGNWMSNEFVERAKVTKWGCPENMSDKHADFSSVRIIENTPARTVVVWRQLPVGVNQKIPFQSEESQWGDCSEETYIFYPDGVCVRKMELWTSAPAAWMEWSQSLQVLHPSQRPEDVLDAARIMSVAAMDGRTETYGWDFDAEKRQDAPSLPGANIQVTYLDSQWNPYLILEDGYGLNEKNMRGPRIDRYSGRWSDYSDFPWRNHWPVAQDYVVGRYAVVADAPSHTYTATQYNAPHSVELISLMPDQVGHDERVIPGVTGNLTEPPYTSKVTPDELSSTWKITKLMLLGCTEGDAVDLLPLAKSWLRAPKMTCGEVEVPYDVEQRAYVISSEVEKSLSLRLHASPEQPSNGVCLILPGVGAVPSAIKVDGKAYADFKIGVNTGPAGSSLILWLPLSATAPVSIDIVK